MFQAVLSLALSPDPHLSPHTQSHSSPCPTTCMVYLPGTPYPPAPSTHLCRALAPGLGHPPGRSKENSSWRRGPSPVLGCWRLGWVRKSHVLSILGKAEEHAALETRDKIWALCSGREEQLGGGGAIQQHSGCCGLGLVDVHWGPRALLPKLACGKTELQGPCTCGSRTRRRPGWSSPPHTASARRPEGLLGEAAL